MGLKTTGTLIGSAATALTSSYVALGNLQVGGSVGMILMVEWTPGSGGTTRSLALKAEFAYDDAGTTYFQESYNVLGSGANVITDKEHQINGVAASTPTKKLIPIRCYGRNAKISVKETLAGGGDAGTITVRSVFVEDDDFMNELLPTISVSIDEFPAAALLGDNTALPTTTQVGAAMEAYDGSNLDLVRQGQTANNASIVGFLNTVPMARYNATPTARTEGQFGTLQADANGALNVNPGALSSASDTVSAHGAASASVGGTDTYYNAALSNTVVSMKASAGNFYGFNQVYNSGGAVSFLQMFDLATGSVTLGTTTPKQSYAIQPSGVPFLNPKNTPDSYLTAISIAATLTAAGSGAPSANFLTNASYK